MDGQQQDRKRATSANSSLAKWRVQCLPVGRQASYDSFVVGSSTVLRWNFCAPKPACRQAGPPLRQAAKRKRKIYGLLGRRRISGRANAGGL